MASPKNMKVITLSRDEMEYLWSTILNIAEKDGNKEELSSTEVAEAKEFLKKYSKFKTHAKYFTDNSVNLLVERLNKADQLLKNNPERKESCSDTYHEGMSVKKCWVRDKLISMGFYIYNGKEILFEDPKVVQRRGEWKTFPLSDNEQD